MSRRHQVHRCFCLHFGLLLVGFASPIRAERAIDFKTDVQPILTKQGCNQGACHGSQHGKGGFKLSLRGFDDTTDYQEIVKSAKARRALLSEPELSLLLTKPALDVPHKGGERLKRGSSEYETILTWLEQGAHGPSGKDRNIRQIVIHPEESIVAPGKVIALEVIAVYDDGSKEPVLNKATFDSASPGIAEVNEQGQVTAKGAGETAIMVRYLGKVGVSRVLIPFGKSEGLDVFSIHNRVDELWTQKWNKLGLSPARICSDTDFYRRIHLDTLGTLPSAEQVRAFVADMSVDKRAKAIDAVLERPEYVDFWAYKWGDLLRSNRNQLGEKGMWSFHNWLRASFRDNKPMDKFTEEIITAVGSPFQNGPANFFRVGGSAPDWAENAAQVFLGVRIQCARCHHHPFESISQADYYGLVAFFSRVGTKGSQEFGIFNNDTVVFVRDAGDTSHPRTGQVMKPTPLGGEPTDDPLDRRRALARWLLDRGNPALARNLANRYWGYYMGRGLVDPIDDIRASNPASCQEVLDFLAQDLIDHGYDVKHLLRTIMNSHVYQLSSTSRKESNADPANKFFTHYTAKRLTAEQLLDAIDAACGTQEKFAQLPAGYRAISLPDSNVQSKFMDDFGRPKREMACECERSDTPNMTQALQFMTGDLLNGKVTAKGGRIERLIAAKKSIPESIQEIYLQTVSRFPTADEAEKAALLVNKAPSSREGLEDLLWTMLNTREFQFNH
ncbi:MAG: DUF1549 and DUF1553 domain-containing protein [Planctomycetota bacterium]